MNLKLQEIYRIWWRKISWRNLEILY